MRRQLLFLLLSGIYVLGFGQITEAEYFIDNDPGVGNATNVSITSGNSISETFTIPTTSLSEGLHVLHIRIKGTNNVWSLYYRDYFYIHTIETPLIAQPITNAEYFIDTDPGVGSGTALTVSSGNSVDEIFTIPSTGLTEGLHVLHIRAKDDDNTWSLYYRDYFYIHTINSETSMPIASAEYFFDTDPGVGSGINLPITSGFNLNETLAIDVPMTMMDGEHYLHIRVVDQDDNWSLYTRALFEVDSTLSVELFTDNLWHVFPNPTNNVLNVNFNVLSNCKMSLYDVNGKELFSKAVNSLLNTINFTMYEDGVYILKIEDQKSSQSRDVKIVKH